MLNPTLVDAEGDLNHADVQPGFITSIMTGKETYTAFVRFFRQAAYIHYDLRTVANGENCNLRHLVLRNHRDQDAINQMTVKCLFDVNLFWEPDMPEPRPMTDELYESKGAENVLR